MAKFKYRRSRYVLGLALLMFTFSCTQPAPLEVTPTYVDPTPTEIYTPESTMDEELDAKTDADPTPTGINTPDDTSDKELDAKTDLDLDEVVAFTQFAFERTDWINVTAGIVQAGDMDGDGDLDIVGIGGNENNINILENEGNAKSWKLWEHLDSTGEAHQNGTVLFDVDGDGDLDIFGQKLYNDLGWWENPDGPLSSSKWSFHKLGGGVNNWFLHDVILGDLDKDGKAEEHVVVLQQGYWDAPVRIYWYRPGADPYQDWERYVITENQAGPNNNHTGIDLGDLDNDGDIDLAFSNGWFESPGDPKGSWTWHKLTDIYGLSNTLMRDIDDDNDLDLVMSAGHHGQGAYWFENIGNPKDISSWIKHNISKLTSEDDIYSRHKYKASDPEHLHHPEGLQVLDLDKDGDLDVITVDLFFGEGGGEPEWTDEVHNVYVFENLGGSPPQWSKHNVSPNSWPSHQIQAYDINEDGMMDFITEGPVISNVSYLENTGE